MTLAEIIANANADPTFSPGFSSNEIWFGNSTNDRLTDVIADVAEAVQGKAETIHTHDGYATASHTHDGYAASTHTHTPASIGAAAADHSHNYAAPTHSHTQTDISGLSDALAAKANASALTAKADLVDGKVPTSQLPAFVDDVLEYTDLANFPTTGESGKIYVAQDTNKTYRWSGTAYVEISASIALGETAATAYRGDRGKIAYDHSQNSSVHVTAAQKDSWDGKAAGDHTHTPAAIGAAPTSHSHSDYAASNHGHTGYADEDHTHTAADVGALPTSGGTVTGATTFNNAVTVKGKAYTQQMLPFDGGSYSIGSADNRYYSTYLRVNPNVSSDLRCKRDIAPMDIDALAAFVAKLSVVNYNYNDDAANEAKRIGLIAQDVVAADPTIAQGCIEQDEKGFYSLRAADLVFPLIAAVQALTKRVEELEGK